MAEETATRPFSVSMMYQKIQPPNVYNVLVVYKVEAMNVNEALGIAIGMAKEEEKLKGHSLTQSVVLEF
jgi:hypothetical protein